MFWCSFIPSSTCTNLLFWGLLEEVTFRVIKMAFSNTRKAPCFSWIWHFCSAIMWKHNKLFSSRQIGGRLKRIEQNHTIFFANVFGIFDVVISKIGPIRPRGILGVPNPPRGHTLASPEVPILRLQWRHQRRSSFKRR